MALASATATVSSFAALRLSPPSTSTRVSFSSVKSPFSNNVNSLKLNWSCSISAPILNQNHSIVTTSPRSLTIVSAKGYKMKTHKQSDLGSLVPEKLCVGEPESSIYSTKRIRRGN
ncbi:50S ribosomal protein L35 [Medicago truncatula]|uniref:50S ribosomal protein L35 n=1 Tax=Medicago truncatula TaxID=3880 RepID=A0A072US19_MEDTR|nr:50S ribosomal protein L35 [Medicago truncatula]